MTTKAKQKKRKELLWGIGALTLILTALLLIAVWLPSNAEEELEPTVAAAVEPATQSTEPTLPPPEANPYGPTDFQYDGNYLSCLAGESVLGIDVSEHQESIDWDAVKEAGVEFVMIRVGYRGYESGGVYSDAAAEEHYQGAKAAGLKIGAYFFSQAVNTAEAMEEARFTLNAIQNWELDMPVVYDWEYISEEARTWAVSRLDLTYCVMTFCNAIRDAGYDPMVYFNQNQAQNLLYLELLKDYDFWLAMYSDRMTYPYKLTMWQYTCYGVVPGIEGEVDLDLYFLY